MTPSNDSAPDTDTQQPTSEIANETTILAEIDPELRGVATQIPAEFELITRDTLSDVRTMGKSLFIPPNLDGVTVTEKEIPTEDGTVGVYIYQPEGISGSKPGILWIHGGGYIMGNAQTATPINFARDFGVTVVSVDYRVAPEHPFPAGTNDCTAALRWMADNSQSLCINPENIVVAGESAGAGMAAGVVLRNRDEQGPKVAAQYLLYPMLDNLHDTASGSREGYPLWDRQTSLNAWEMYLDGVPGKMASPYAAAARAKDLSGLPPTFIAVGGSDLFRDEDIEFAQRLMSAGVPTELGVFPGVFHGGQIFVPDAAISKCMNTSCTQAMRRALFPAD